MSEPVNAANEVKPAVSPTGKPVLPPVVVTIGAILVGLAGVVLGLPTAGVTLPPAVLAIAGGIVALGAAFGIASPGIRRKE